MNERFYQYLIGGLCIAVFVSLMWPSKPKENYNVNVQTITSASEGLDLQAVGALVKKAKDGEHLERLLNDKKEGLNNLDLDLDDKVDFIKVTEYGDAKVKGFSLTTEPASGEEQEIATIEIEKSEADKASVQVRGNQNIYGNNHYHHSYFPIGSFLLWSYLLRPHTPYYSPWRYGAYPTYYRPYSTVNTTTYRSKSTAAGRSANMQRTSSSKINSQVKSPNAGKTASKIKAPLKNPTTSQKSFQARNPATKVRSGGFGRKSTSSTSLPGYRPSVRKNSFGRSGSRFGGK